MMEEYIMILYTINEAASKLGLSEQILSRMESEGKLHPIIVKPSGKEIKSYNLY